MRLYILLRELIHGILLPVAFVLACAIGTYGGLKLVGNLAQQAGNRRSEQVHSRPMATKRLAPKVTIRKDDRSKSRWAAQAKALPAAGSAKTKTGRLVIRRSPDGRSRLIVERENPYSPPPAKNPSRY